MGIVHAVRQRAPRSRIVLVDYLPNFTAESATSPDAFTDLEIDQFRGIAQTLSAMVIDAACQTGADVITASAYSREHGGGATTPWITGLQPLRRIGSSFHPTAAGMEVVARAITRHVSGLDADAA